LLAYTLDAVVLQALKDSFTQARSATDAEIEVASKNAEQRVAAALKAMGHNGYTLVSTPPNVRPTVRDYHYSYMKGKKKHMQRVQLDIPVLLTAQAACRGSQGAAVLTNDSCSDDIADHQDQHLLGLTNLALLVRCYLPHVHPCAHICRLHPAAGTAVQLQYACKLATQASEHHLSQHCRARSCRHDHTHDGGREAG
jgi:hypothetical protein